MQTVSRVFLGLSAAILLLATGLGAYASHGLGADVSTATRSAFGTAVEYQFYHGLGLVAIAILTERAPDSKLLRTAGWLLVTGIVLFCGSIYATTFGAPASLGAAAPLGGTAFMAAWLVLGLSAWRSGAADPLA
jgi:uncharacterized membrane protein YgdD (TMEM256/DUF423 family)